MFAPGRVIFGYLRDIRKQCNRKVAKQAVAFCLCFAAMSALFVLLRALLHSDNGNQKRDVYNVLAPDSITGRKQQHP